MKKSLVLFLLLTGLVFSSFTALAALSTGYSTGSTYVFYNGTPITNITASPSGGSAPYTFSAVSLPLGLSLNASTGAISGTPTVTAATTGYVVKVTDNVGATATSTINIAIDGISYASSNYTFYNGVTITSQTITKVGSPTSYSISPSLNANTGLTFSTTSGTISGKPTSPYVATVYTVQANYSAGTQTTTSVTITVEGINYAGSPYSFLQGVAISPVSPTVTGDTPTSYSAGSLPSGLAIDPVSGVISGTPTVASTSTAYTIQANYGGGSTTTAINITVPAPTINYATGNIFYNGTAITPLSPTFTGSPTGYSVISPSLPLPTGLAINPSTGVISGTPTVNSANSNYTITASYAGGITATKTITMQVNGISYVGSPFTYNQGAAIATASPTTIGTPTGYAISVSSPTATLPTGLSLNSSTGQITGTPTQVVNPAAVYTITATYSGGSASTNISIAVQAPTYNYTGSPYTFYKGISITNQYPVKTGTPTGYQYDPATGLPPGLAVGPTSGTLYGRPTAGSLATNYNIIAIYSGGVTATTTVNIAVNGISYTGAPFTYYQGSPITAALPSVIGETPTAYAITPNLNTYTGLTFDATTGQISGTPTGAPSSVNYTITATYANSKISTVAVKIIIAAPTLTYTTISTFITGTAITPLTPTVKGSPINYSVSNTSGLALPAGLSIDNTTGVISGTPTATQNYTVYTITATYANGIKATKNIGLTVNGFSYPATTFTYYLGTTISSVNPARNGTPTSCSATLPAGLAVSSTGVISGTPTGSPSSGTYTVTATFASGSVNANITIQVLAPTISYASSNYTFFKGTTITNQVVTKTGSPVSYSIISSPSSLPAGLALSPTTGTIYGTPSVPTATTSYTIQAKYAGTVTANYNVNITVDGLTYPSTSYSFRTGTPISNIIPVTIGATSSYAISPSTLPAGLVFDNTTGIISGTPTAAFAQTLYTITVNFAGGSSIAKMYIRVSNASITYPSGAYTFYANTTISSLTPTITGTPTGIAVNPALPTGLAISSTTGVISGKPTIKTAGKTYVVTATYAGGITATRNVYIVVDGFVYTTSTFTYYQGATIATVTPSRVGTPASYSISPNLTTNTGLNLNPTTGQITGTPNATSIATTYTVTAAYAGTTSTTSATINITVLAPTLSYTGSPVTYYTGAASTNWTPTTAGSFTSYQLIASPSSPPVAFPPGLAIRNNTGIIYGIPTAATAAGNYTIQATNAGGATASATVNITVLASTISYSSATYTFYQGTAITSLTPTKVGTTPTSYSISPALPAGLSISSTGVISGTSTVASASKAYTVKALYAGGVSSTYGINITVLAPTLSYTTPLTYFSGTAISTLSPTVTGTPIGGYAVSPALPAGLTLNNSNGQITGTPTTATVTGTYTVTATYAGTVTATANISITVNGISYTGSPFIFTKNVAITPITPVKVGTLTGANPYAISPTTLPAGLSFSKTTGVISGTPTANTPQATYTITATFTGGSSTAVIIIAVGTPVITYSSSAYSFYQGATVSLTPSVTGGTSPYIYSIGSTLPAGLAFDNTTGIISGTATAASATAAYTITVMDNFGVTSSTPINITVIATSVAYAGSPYSYFTGTAITSLTPTVSGTPTSFGISPALPAGLSFNTTTGVISGTPTAAAASGNYNVSANYPGGATATAVLNFTVTASTILYSGSPFTYYPGTAVTLTPAVTGSAISFGINNTLPTGLSFDTSTGIISGTPTGIAAAADYIVTANYSAGVTATATINIGVSANTISYAGAPFTYYNGSAITNISPTVTGSPTGFSAASLPAGLVIDPTTGLISGTPTATAAAQDYSITATYAAGSVTGPVNIAVISPSVSYTGSPFTFYSGSAISDLIPTITGTPVTYAISPSLPSGLIFDGASATITGTPTAASAATDYIVTLTYAGSVTATATINITVTAPTISYAGTPFTFYNGADIGTLTPTVTGTPASYAISPSLSATGLSIDNATGIITGIPAATTGTVAYIVTATYSGGVTATAPFNITFANPSINYTGSPYNYFTGTPITNLTPTITGSPTSILVSPALPTGLAIDPSTGIISGTPTVATATAAYTITTTNDGGVSASATINITVNASSISYTGSPFTYFTGAAITSLTPVVTGTATSFSISPALPGGLVFDGTSGIISGTPNAASTATDYTVTASYASGVSATATINIVVFVPAISYAGSPLTLYQGSLISSLTPTVTGNSTSFSINPTLPSGLAFDVNTGIITGTPSVQSAATDYTITASFTGGVMATATVNITVTAPTFVYTGSPYTYYNGTPITPVSPTNMGSPTGYSIGSTLPAGLSFSTSTGTISGTPSATSAPANYLVTANYAGGVTSTFTVNINVSGPLYTWTGAGPDANWNDASNWSSVGGGFPGASNNATIPTTSNPPTLNVASTIASIIITSSTTINLAAPLTVTGGLFLPGGNLTFTGTDAATIGGASTIGSTNNLTVGSSNTVSFNAINLTLTDGNTSGTTEAITNNGTLNLNSTTLNEGLYLTINNAGSLNLDNSTVILGNAVTDFTNYSSNLTTGTAAYSLTNNGTLTANDNSVFTLNNVGTIYNASTFIAGTSGSACTLNLGGNGSSIVNAGTFVEGSTSTINLTGGSYNTGFGTVNAAVINTSGNIFALTSDASGSATIGQITNGGVFTGSFYVQRYLPSASSGGYRLLSSPVFGGTSASPATNYADLTYLNTTTPFINGINYPGAATGGPGGAVSGFTLANGNPTVYLYDEAIVPASGTARTFFNGKNVGLTKITPTSVQYTNTNLSPSTGSTPVYAGNGLTFYDFGPTSGYAAHGAINATTISYSGQINQSNIPFYSWHAPTGNLSYTAGLGASFAGYNLVGNPYASTIDLNKLAADNFASGTVTFYELTDAQTYCSWTYNVTSGIGTSDGTSVQYISSGQGFFIQATGTGQSLIFKEDQKVNASVPAGFLAAPNNHQIGMSNNLAGLNRSANNTQISNDKHTGLHLMLAKDSLTFKTCGIFFDNLWNDKLDGNDAKDIDGINPKVYLSSFTTDGLRTSINSMANYDHGKNVKLYMSATTDGSYKMSLMDMANIDTVNYSVYLVDNYKKDTVNIGENKTYTFNIAIADTATFGVDRFVLNISPKRSGHYKLLSFNGIKHTANVALAWKTNNEGVFTTFGLQKYDAASRSFKTIDSLQSNGGSVYNYVDESPIKGTNTYRLVQNSVDGTISYSNALVINYGTNGILNVYPNPVVDVVTVNLTSVTNSITETYDITIYNASGTLVMQKSGSGDAISQDVSALKPGVYIVDVKSKYGNSIGNAKFLKN